MYHKSIGETAGLIWKTLGTQEKVALSALPKLVDRDGALVQQAVGWLARENKVDFVKQGKSLFVKLTDEETQAYKSSNGK